MSPERRWTAASEDALSWLAGKAVDGGVAGFDVGPMPDRVFVLHPLTERVDGRQVDDSGEHEATRSLRWDEYARRRQIPMFDRPSWPGYTHSLLGLLDDEFVYAPDEGDLADPVTRDAVLRILRAHTAGGGAQLGTAFYFEFWLHGDPPRVPALPHVLRGPMGECAELFDRPGYVNSPKNLWPDDHSWVLYTDEDAWCTVISGSTELVEDVLHCPQLEALRIPDLG